jgi:hypothetical protein
MRLKSQFNSALRRAAQLDERMIEHDVINLRL